MPPPIRALFWDYADGDVSWECHREFIVGRVLEAGDWEAIKWLRREAGDESIRNYLERTHGRKLDRRQLRLWQLTARPPGGPGFRLAQLGGAPGVGREIPLSRFHLEVLPDLQRAALEAIGRPASGTGFYLAGGTAVALHLGHRRSIHFDWFTGEELEDPLALAARLRTAGVPLDIGSTGPGTLHGTVGGVRVSFLSYRYPLLQPSVPWPEQSCQLAALEDLACMKLAALAQRGARKDYLDVFAIGERLMLPEMLDLYRRKYCTQDVGHLLAGLCYFDDAERQPMPSLLQPIEWEDVKSRLRSWVKDYAG